MVRISNAGYAALVSERDQLAVRVAAQAEALESLRRLDFQLRADGGEGLPTQACKVIDGELDYVKAAEWNWKAAERVVKLNADGTPMTQMKSAPSVNNEPLPCTACSGNLTMPSRMGMSAFNSRCDGCGKMFSTAAILGLSSPPLSHWQLALAASCWSINF